MKSRITQFRSQVASHFGGRPGPGARYPEGLRALAVEVACLGVGRGKALGSVAVDLGVGAGTLRRWLESSSGGSSPLRAVEVVEDEGVEVTDVRGGGLVLVTSSGHRVEGLALGEVALLLESLS